MLLILMEILLIPYIGWGIYLLRRRLQHHDEIPPSTMGLTLLGVLTFFLLEMALLEALLRDSLITFIFATLGLVVSCAALYGHVVVAFLAWLLVDFFMPGEVRMGDQPRMGPSEALERHGDYRGALEGYRVLARIYPANSEIAMRIAENLGRLDRGEEVPRWITRAIDNSHDASQEFDMVSRGCEVYERALARQEDARLLLRDYLSRHPHAEESAMALERLAQVGAAKAVLQSEALAVLADNPLEAAQAMVEERSRGHKKVKLGIARVDSALAGDETEAREEDAPIMSKASGVSITPLGLGESITPHESDEDRRPRRINRIRLDRDEEVSDA